MRYSPTSPERAAVAGAVLAYISRAGSRGLIALVLPFVVLVIAAFVLQNVL